MISSIVALPTYLPPVSDLTYTQAAARLEAVEAFLRAVTARCAHFRPPPAGLVGAAGAALGEAAAGGAGATVEELGEDQGGQEEEGQGQEQGYLNGHHQHNHQQHHHHHEEESAPPAIEV